MRVRDYMTTEVIYANPEDGLRQTFYRMRERNIRHMPVYGDHEELIRVSEGDYEKLLGEATYLDISHPPDSALRRE